LKPQLIALYEQSHVIETMLNESESFTLDTSSKQPPASLDDLPLIVLTAGKPEDAGPDATPDFVQETEKVRVELQRELAALSTNGKQIIATQSGHALHYDQPELLIAAIEDLVQRVRDQRPPDE
jgi:hypothetical protein